MHNYNEYQKQLTHIHSLDPDTLFAGCQELCEWLTDGDSEQEPEKRKQPCPNCGGEDRFRFAPDLDRPSFFCNICKPSGGWDGIALVQEFGGDEGIDHKEAVRLLAEATGYESEYPSSHAERKQSEKPKPLPTFALVEDAYNVVPELKCRPEIDFAAYERAGAKGFGSGVAIPMFGNDGELSGYVRYFMNGAKKNSAGSKSGIVGIETRDALLSKRSAKMVIKTAGVSDYLVLSKLIGENGHEADYYAFTNGAGEMENPDKFEPILRPALEGKAVMVLQDNDTTGVVGAIKWAKGMAKYAADVRIVRLPQEWNGKPIKDFRDFVAAADNTSDVLHWIHEAFKNTESITPDSIIAQNQPPMSESSLDETEPPRPWQPFPLSTLPPLLRNFVVTVSKSIGIDPTHNAVCVLSIISGIIGRTFWLKIKYGYVEPAMLWIALIADSGFGKSPALTPAQEPIVQLQCEALDIFEAEMQQYDANSETYRQLQKQQKGESRVALIKPVKPVMQRYFISDCTTEALLPILSDNPYGVCLIRDELAAFLNGMDAYRGVKVDRQVYIEIHGGRFVQSDRKKDREYIVARTPSVSIIGGIQSDVICQTVNNEPEFLTTGFGARFLMAYPPALPVRWNTNEIDPAVQLHYTGLIRELLAYRKHFIPDKPGTAELTPEAKTLIFDFQNRHADDSLGIADGNVRYVENKAGIHCARLCLVLHVVKCTESGIDPISPVILETMQQAIALTEWFLNEAHRIYAMFAGKEVPVDRTALLIKTMIQMCGGEATALEIKKRSNVLHNRMDTAALKAKLDGMVKIGRAHV
jgi:hypothetical protein